ncbi:Hsp20/alpha crystallin family protein [Ferruginibacter albus]|uniref:Hsp20/alpha crystallin family protein n=1 Tax=Ferruginibacter albus TaxID=2875540 RepID=UPI001CC4D8D3|nr:Hsp20/alpha crystallin family protein [Ferruginibacter albus]UAY50773.1 Hsp20/alpha crystallin family protein [Ferruginibacter albus]
MTTITSLQPENTYTYPGTFNPPKFDWEELMKELGKPREGKINPSVNIIEHIDYYKVELAVPGLTKDDFVVNVQDNQLSIVVMKPKETNAINYHVHGFNFECFSHLIDLPGNIETDFISAEYEAGILSICFPKVDAPVVNTSHRIVIY